MGNHDGMWPPPALVPEAYTYDSDGQIVGQASPLEPDDHETTVVTEGDLFGWECSCGEEATGFEDFDAADSDADEHRQNNY